jgi:hypothetical protein
MPRAEWPKIGVRFRTSRIFSFSVLRVYTECVWRPPGILLTGFRGKSIAAWSQWYEGESQVHIHIVKRKICDIRDWKRIIHFSTYPSPTLLHLSHRFTGASITSRYATSLVYVRFPSVYIETDATVSSELWTYRNFWLHDNMSRVNWQGNGLIRQLNAPAALSPGKELPT